MEKHNKSAFQRVLAFALTLIMVVGMLPMNVTALEPSDRATVTLLDGVSAADDGNGNLTVTEATLNWSAATAEHGEGWWVGVGITAPETITSEELALATYTVDGGLPESFASKSGSTNYIQLWIPVTEEFLAAGVPETDIYEFNWNGLGDNNQTVTLTVVPSESIVLNPKAPDPEPEPETVTLTVSKTGNGTVKVNGSEVGDSVTVLKDTAVPVEVTPAAGYKIASLTVGGVSKTDEEHYSENVAFSDGGSIVVTFEAIAYSISAPSVTGGTVTVTDAEQNPVTTAHYGDKITVSVTADPGYRIGSIKVGETEISNQDTITVTDDITVKVTFVKVYTVAVHYDENGSVKVDGQEVVTGGSITVDEGESNIIVTVTPNENYLVSSIKINSEEEELAADNTYNLPKDKDYTIEVSFAPSSYSVVVDPVENGTVTCDPTGETVNYGDSVTVTVVPDEGYKVDTVTVNDVAVSLDENGQFTISNIKDNQTIKVTFASLHTVTVAKEGNGTVAADKSLVDDDQEVKITITPDEGYTVNQVLVNGEERNDLTLVAGTDNQFTLTIKATDNLNIEVSFAAIDVTNEGLDIDGELVWEKTDETTHTFAHKCNADGSITFTTDKVGINNEFGIRIKPAVGDNLGGIGQKQIVINETIDVSKIELYYQAEGELVPCWHPVQIQPEGKILKFVIIDENTQTAEGIQILGTATNGYYCADFNVKFHVQDGTGESIKSVEYYVIKNATESDSVKTPKGTLYTSGGEATLDNLQFTVDAAQNNGDNTKIVVEVKDQAGNITTYEKLVNISYVTATIEFSGTPNTTILRDKGGVIGYYNQSRTATITVIENAHRFDSDNVKYCISAFFTGGTPVNPEDAYTEGVWESIGDQHTLTITFHDVEVVNDDGEVTYEGVNYSWEFDKNTEKTYLTYTDAAGRNLEFQVVEGSETPYYFAVDKTPPHVASIIINEGKTDKKVWETWREDWLEFSLYKNADYTITLNGSDEVSRVQLQYFSTENTERLSLEQLQDGDPDNGEFEAVSENPYTINDEGPRVVYLKVTDYAGNTTYVNSDGVILDRADKEQDETIKLTLPEGNHPYGAAGGDKVSVEVEVESTSSGIQKIEYWIEKDNVAGEPVELFSYNFTSDDPNITEPSYDNLCWKWTGSIDVNKADNNNGNMVVRVRVTDNADNEKNSSIPLSIDITPPEITLDPEDANANGIYGLSYEEGVKVYLNVSDGGDSGIKSIEYRVVVKDGDTENLTQSGTCTAETEYITVDTEKNNSSNVVVYAKVTDNAENFGEDVVTLNIDVTPPDATLNPQNPAKTREENGETIYVYNKSAGENVAVKLDVSDGGDSGIASVEYWIEKDGNAGPSTTYTTLEGIPSEILVNTAANNSSNVVVHVRVTDNAGNSDEDCVKLDIDMTPPEIELDYIIEGPVLGPYSENRVVVIKVTERKNDYMDKAVEDAISIVAKVRSEVGSEDFVEIENAADNYYTIQYDYDHENGQYIVTINLIKDAMYYLTVFNITDLAGNTGDKIRMGDRSVALPYTEYYGVDHTPPTGTVSWSTEDGNGDSSCDLLKENTHFYSYYNEKVSVTFTDDDVGVFGVKSIYYYLSHDNEVLTDTKLKSVPWTESLSRTELVTLEPDQKVTVYVKLVDSMGRVNYISTNGMILDDTLPKVVDITMEGNMRNDFYTGDVTVKVTVTDPGTNGPASEFAEKDITITVIDSNNTQKQVDVENWQITDDESGCFWTGTFVLKNQEGFDNNEYTVTVNAKDQAGNEAAPMSKTLKIDAVEPVVSVAYVDYGNHNNGYYTGGRTATITVVERNFNKENIEIAITNAYGEVPKVGGWTKNNAGTAYTANVEFAVDGEYTLEVVSCKDDAGNEGGGVDPVTFIIDKTPPVITVNYNNNDAQNDRYFKEPRVATITIKEQNFDENKVTITQTAAQGGVAPNVAWAHNGDTHVATLTYSVDGVYTFDITATDAAGNPSAEATFNGVAGKDFVIDTTYEDMVTIGGVANGKAYGYGETPIPTVQIGDINLDEYGIKLTGIQKGKTIDLTDQVHALLNAGAQEVNGTFDIFQVVQDLDGIYTLSVYGLDKAGNEDREEVTFTVNRFGSVYVYNDYLMGLIANGGARTPKLTDDLVITEYNAVKLLEGSLVIEITCDGRPVEDPIYEATPEINDSVAVGESGWYQYRYTISKENFTSDGVYKITVSSKDAAGNAAENNNYDGMAITFRVDSTAPEITSIVGLEEAIIDAAQVTVKYTAYDTMGLKSIQVYVDGVLVDEVTDFSADLSNYSGSFTLTEKNAVQHVRIVVEDLSGNVTDTDSEYFVSAYEFHKDVTVTTNIFVQWYANKGLFWGSIIGAGVLASLIIFLIAKRKKKEER